MNIHSKLISEMSAKEYREAYVASQINIGIPFQIRALRKSRGWHQECLAEHAKMAQPRISEIERPGERRLNIETLLRISAAFDVGLQVRFVPFSELINWSESFDPEDFEVKSFDDEIAELTAAEMHDDLGQSNVLTKWYGQESAANAQFGLGQPVEATVPRSIIPFPLVQALTEGNRACR